MYVWFGQPYTSQRCLHPPWIQRKKVLSVFICRWAALRSRLRVKPTQDTDHLISSRVKALGTLREVRALTSQRGVCTYKSERCVHLQVREVRALTSQRGACTYKSERCVHLQVREVRALTSQRGACTYMLRECLLQVSIMLVLMRIMSQAH
jgi:hypothetical protein